MKPEKMIRQKAVGIIGELNEVKLALDGFKQNEFPSQAEEREKFKLILKRTKLLSQLELISWILGAKNE